MEKVERYQCNHCKKLFKINRHFCFKDPENKACASCQYYGGEETNTYEDGSKYTSYICKYDNETWVIYEYNDFGTKSEVPFKDHHGNRGYNCEWWKKRIDEKQLGYQQLDPDTEKLVRELADK